MSPERILRKLPQAHVVDGSRACPHALHSPSSKPQPMTWAHQDSCCHSTGSLGETLWRGNPDGPKNKPTEKYDVPLLRPKTAVPAALVLEQIPMHILAVTKGAWAE